MKRIISVLAVMAIMAAMLVAMAAPAFASGGGANDNANRVGQLASQLNQEQEVGPGLGGRVVAENKLGQLFNPMPRGADSTHRE